MNELWSTFDVTMTPADGLLPGTARFTLAKRWSGAMEGTSEGTMLSAGVPSSGAAGYVALEVFTGSIDDRAGTIALQQLGRMAAGAEPELAYQLVPGSGTGDLAGLAGELHLEVDDEGVHRVRLVLS